MTAKVVIDLPLSGAGCGAIQLSTDGVDLEVSVYSGLRKIGKLSFDTVVAFRFRDEMHSLGFLEESYDAVVEIAQSEWLSQILALEPDAIHLTAKNCKHFAVMLSSNGYLEVIARSVGFEA
jgi:hypothetical protein